ncbi:MAG: hypothetical protein IJ764_02140 [Bacteroidales bacterium]|nr:hypothetical protein [Bacteroidales bacterium]
MARRKIDSGSMEERRKVDLSKRILQIRQTFFNDSNRLFSEKIAVNEQALSQICNGKRNAGIEIVQKIIDNMQEVNANWLMTGLGEMTNTNEQSVGDIKNSSVVGVNVQGESIQINQNHPDAYTTLMAIVEMNQKETAKFQEQIDRLIAIIEKKL